MTINQTGEARAAYAPEDFGIGRLFELTRDAVILVDLASGRIVLVNPATESLFGYPPFELLNLPVDTLFPGARVRGRAEPAGDHSKVILDEQPDADQPIELLGRRSEGTLIAVELTITRLVDVPAPGAFLLIVGREAVGRARQEDRLGRERADAARAAAEEAAAAIAELNRIGQLLAAELDQERLLQSIVDTATRLTGAAFGAFFYNAVDEQGEIYSLYVLSGVPREAFSRLPMPRPTAIFGPTFRGEDPVRLDDVRADPRFGQNDPYWGMPEGHLPVVSYLAVPVISRTGRVLGGLFFGHPEPRMFDRRAEDLAAGLASHASVALDNAVLLERVRSSEDRYRGLFAGVADAILVANADRRFLEANPAAEELLGYTSGELVGMRVDDIVERSPAWTATEYERYLASGHWRGELVLRRKDGSTVPVDARASIVDLPSGPVYLSAVRDVTERQRLEELRRDFLAMVTHDLRTPLTTIRGYTQLLRRRGEYRAGTVDAMLEQSDRMQRLLDDLADVVRLEAGKLPLQRAPVDLVEIARREAMAVPVTAANHQLVVEAPNGPVQGRWDGNRLGQVFANLIGNAVKYSPEGGQVLVRVEASEHTARVIVRDEGPGIRPEHLPKLFERFYRADGSGAGGLGLGLYVSRLLVEAHGGAISVASEPGRGSTFTVSLPLDSP